MNKATKIIVILMITTIVLYTVVGVYNQKENDKNNLESGDILSSGDVSDSFDEISYQVLSGDNEIILKGISEGAISTTTYAFENEKLISIILKEEITSGDDELVENVFNHMKNDYEMSIVYSNIEKQGNTIIAVLKDEYVDAYGDASKVEVYEQLLKLLETENN